MDEFQYTYNKKIIATFDNYDHFYEHIRDHELYMDWVRDELTGGLHLYDIPVPNALGGNDPISVTFWCGEDRIEVTGGEIPQWSEVIDGLPIRCVYLIPERFVDSALAAIQRIGATVGVPVDRIEVVNNPA
jgi:hypothetical protein